MTPISIAAYLALFATVAFLFVLVSLVLGRFLRPSAPSPQKLETYECGEPAVGSSYVQFDLRFYVVALVFIIFEVEVAFFFPWASVFGKVMRQLANPATSQAAGVAGGEVAAPAGGSSLSPRQGAPAAEAMLVAWRRLAVAAMVDIAVFFAVLLVAFAYVWSRGDLDWVLAQGGPPSAIAGQGEQSRGRL